MKINFLLKAVLVSAVFAFVSGCTTPPAPTEDEKPEEPGTGADTRPAKCLLVVNGNTYIDGTCKYAADPDGSFRLFGKKYFSYVNVFENGKAAASWNADPKNTHAQAPLGEVTRDGACWTNETTKICAWDSTSTRLLFAKGATKAIVNGELSSYDDEHVYVLKVNNAQTMTVEQVSPGDKRVTLAITAPNGEDVSDMDLSCNNNKTVSPTVEGDYTIRVGECMKANAWKGSYKLKITVE